MPSADPPAKVLVTGSNGYIAVWIIRILLERGFAVRGTIRAERKGTYLLNLFKNEVKNGRLELVVVPGLIEPGAFDDAVKNVDAIMHTASPADLKGDHPNDYIEPAVKGTIGILESALKHAGPQLKRIMITSSGAAMLNAAGEGVASESSWNEDSVKAVREKGRDALPFHKYSASKLFAEQAAWDFISKNSSVLSWDLVTLCPTWCFGPALQEVTTPSSLNPSAAMFYEALSTKSPEKISGFQSSWVDVRDVAEAHVRALEVSEASGQRFILSSGEFIWQDWYDVTNTLNLPEVSVPIGTPGASKNSPYKMRFDSTKVRSVLGMKFRDMSTTVKDTVEDYKVHGWTMSGGFQTGVRMM